MTIQITMPKVKPSTPPAVASAPKTKHVWGDIMSALRRLLHMPGVKANRAEMTRIQKSVELTEDQIMLAADITAQVALGDLQDSTPERTGTTRKGWSLKVVDKPNGRLYSLEHPDVKAINRLNYGTPAHVILPKNKKALKFMIGGKVVYAKKVMHPGQAGLGFVDRIRAELNRNLQTIGTARQ